MMIDRYSVSALITIITVLILYAGHFYINLGYPVSNNTESWAQLGDYFGGILNPILTFISIILLIKSLTLQNEANRSLRNELSNSERTEKLRSFESMFFNMINYQKTLFDSFNIDVANHQGKLEIIKNVEAFLHLEAVVISKLKNYGDYNEIGELIDSYDKRDYIYSIVRAFFVTVKMVSDKLSDKNGFDQNERDSHFTTLINFTDFTQLRLILLYTQFLDYPPAAYIKNNQEFLSVLEDIGLSVHLYQIQQ